MPHNTFTLQAPAKLNLFLHITGKRADGFHLLQSVMVFVDVGDRLEFAPHDTLFLDVDGPFAADMPPANDNLIYRAAQLLAQEYRTHMRGAVRLTKNLPVASGIAGGSSDSAAGLRGFARLWGLPDEHDRLMRLAQNLGADVPACFIGKPVWAEGIGEKMMRLPEMPQMHFVLANPMVPTPTPEVFKRYRERFSPPIQFSGRRKTMHEWIADLKIYRNDLTEAAMQVTPAIRDVLQALEHTPNCRLARLSGSGATCFGMYDSAEAAMAAVNKLKQLQPGWWIAPANLVR
ncbi:MAG TPA: 4-(cytidine 5'-diphospho)-2-C-methyl-D-erythritol kinase [Patescibacteria group bacterium]|nr:4-(cytidine 5'-diphospho)-2-C-methyl-D-erythritol kinase [Patescibacteria group bacterium]